MKLKGNVSVFLAIILIVMVLFVGTLLDVSRLLYAKSVVKAAMQVSCDSMLASYDRPLREEYGIFAMAPLTEEEHREMAITLLSENLMQPEGMDALDPYGFVVKDAKFYAFHNLSEPAVLKQQIAEFMKLRAPVQMVNQFIDKLAAFSVLMGEADSVEQKMAVELLVAEIRSSTTRVHVLINDYLKNINLNMRSDGTGIKDLKKAVYLQSDACYPSLQNQLQCYAQSFSDPAKHPNTLRTAYQSAQVVLSETDSLIRTTQAKLTPLVENQQAKQKELDGLVAPKNETATAKEKREARATQLRSELAVLDTQMAVIQQELSLHQYVRSSQAETCASTSKALNDVVTTNTAYLNETMKLLRALLDNGNRIKNHLAKQQLYITATKTLCDEIIQKTADLQEKKSQVVASTSEREDTVSKSVQAQVEEMLVQLDPSTYETLKRNSEAMHQQITVWLNSVATYTGIIEQDIALCNQEIVQYQNLTGDIQPMFHPNLTFGCKQGYEVLKTALESLKRHPEGQQFYAIPDWNLQPQVTAEEKLEADRWVKSVLGFEEDMVQEVAQEKEELKQVRSVIGGIAESAKGLFDGNANEIGIKIEPETFSALPSHQGYVSSESILEEIGSLGLTAMENFDSAYTFGTNGGNTRIDERAHGFFQEAALALKGMANAVAQVVKSGVRGLVDGMYVNEYILSAFKCLSTKDNQLPYDIGWGRNLENTFFPQGEIEYILYGNAAENNNLHLAQGSVWTVRFALNLMHVYKSPEKMSTTLGLASAVAGWTLLGVPLVQNLIIIGWSAGESIWDVEELVQGHSVPLLKTTDTWHLDFRNLFGESLQNLVLGEIENQVKDWVNDGIEDVDKTLRNTVQALIGNVVDTIFSGVESYAANAIAPIDISSDHMNDIAVKLTNSIIDQLLTNTRNWSSIDDFTAWLDTSLNSCIDQAKSELIALGNAALAQLKVQLKASIYNAIVNNAAFQGLVSTVKSETNQLIESGFDLISGKKGAGNSFQPGQGARMKAAIIDTTYEDYLRLFLLMVPMELKVKRISDLIQLNLQDMTVNAKPMSAYKTAVWMDAEVEIESWFLLNWWQGEGSRERMMIRMQWGQGY